MSSDMSGPLSERPDDTTTHAQGNNSCLPAGELPNKTTIFISGVRDTRAFMVWWRAYCPGGLTPELEVEKLMVVPSTANGFRAAYSELRSLDGGGFAFSHLHALGRPRCAAPGEEPGQGNA